MIQNKPIVFDLFCGLGGWTEAFLAEGYRCIGFDIEAHDYGNGGYPGELVVCDVRSIKGAELVAKYGIPTVIVASSPCQEYSYMAMPWKKAKEKRRKILADETGVLRAALNDLFEQPARIQREIEEATGICVPMIQENVRGAQEWVGKARWNFGSFYLWGDVPALMPIPGKIRKTPECSWDVTRKNYTGDHSWANGKGEGNKTVDMNWSDKSKRGQDFTRIAGQQADGVKMSSQTVRRTDKGKGARFTSRDCGIEGVKQSGISGKRANGKGDLWFQEGAARSGSKSKTRKQASAEIAKIPFALAQWIARTFKPKTVTTDFPSPPEPPP